MFERYVDVMTFVDVVPYYCNAFAEDNCESIYIMIFIDVIRL